MQHVGEDSGHLCLGIGRKGTCALERQHDSARHRWVKHEVITLLAGLLVELSENLHHSAGLEDLVQCCDQCDLWIVLSHNYAFRLSNRMETLYIVSYFASISKLGYLWELLHFSLATRKQQGILRDIYVLTYPAAPVEQKACPPQ